MVSNSLSNFPLLRFALWLERKDLRLVFFETECFECHIDIRLSECIFGGHSTTVLVITSNTAKLDPLIILVIMYEKANP